MERVQLAQADAHIAQSLHHVVIRLAVGRDSDASIIPRSHHAIHGIDTRELTCGLQAPGIYFMLHHEGIGNGQPRIVPLLVAFRKCNGWPVGIKFHGAAAVANGRHHLHCHPGAGKSRKRDSEQPVV